MSNILDSCNIVSWYPERMWEPYPKELVLDIAQSRGGEWDALGQLVPHLQHIERLELPYMYIYEEHAKELIKLKSLESLKIYTLGVSDDISHPVDMLISCDTIKSLEVEILDDFGYDKGLVRLKNMCNEKGFDVTGKYPTVIKRR